ncbi:MAG: hypothetical protein WBE13_08735 [Candidatus Acidiferrum sp.]
MPFSIEFLDDPVSYPYDDPTTPEARGVLILGEAKEYFGSSLYEWTKKEYETQWRNSIKTLLHGNDRAALITEYVGPQDATHLEWWPLYVVADEVFIQNHLLFYDQLTEPFSTQNPFSFLPDRRTMNEEGEKISEWAVALPEVEEFARGLSL